MAAQVLHCGGAVVYQLLCGSNIAKGNTFAIQMKNYCYLIVNTLDRTAIAVDAAWDVAGILALAEQLGVQVRGCIYTHFHFDHCGGHVDEAFIGARIPPLSGAKDVEDAGGEVWAGEGDAAAIKSQCSLGRTVSSLRDGDVVECGDLALHVLGTPGHTPGSVCIFAAPRCLSPRGAMGTSPFRETVTKAESGLLLTGDTLFVGSCGATHFPGGDSRQMLRTLSRLSAMDPAVIVCPGHAYAPEPFTTIGRERKSNDSMLEGMRQVPSPPPLPPCVACGTAGQACGPRGFVIGRKVRILGLTSEAGKAINGRRGVLEFFNEGKGRYAVKMLGPAEEPISQTEKLVRPENVEVDAGDKGAKVAEDIRSAVEASSQSKGT